MAKLTFHDFHAIHEALNKMIIAEVKAALELMPEKCIREEGSSLCHVIISTNSDYSPCDVAVDEVWVDEKDGLLHVYGRSITGEACIDQNVADSLEQEEWTEQDDLLDITDFKYLIEQIAEQVDGDETYNLPNKSVITAGYMTELSLKSAAEKLVTV